MRVKDLKKLLDEIDDDVVILLEVWERDTQPDVNYSVDKAGMKNHFLVLESHI